jgi:glycerophosphoryl diester phosphodiesterase
MPKTFWDAKTPIPIAHRGGAGVYKLGRFRRENTLEVFKTAIKLGFEYLELDVISTADKKVIALHVTTDRFEALLHKPSAPNANKIQQLTYLQLKAKLGREIPTLEQIFEEFPKTKFLIDTKTDEVIEPLAEVIAKAKAYDNVFLNSFYPHRVARLMDLLGDKVSYGLIIGRYPRLVNRKLLALLHSRYSAAGLSAIVLPYRFMNKGLVNFIHEQGLKAIVWTPNTLPTIERAIESGVDGIMSDNVKLLIKTLG